MTGKREVPSSHAHARAAVTRDEKTERILEIRDCMAALRWVRGKSAAEFAARWGVAVSTVEGYAAIASRMIVADADDARRDITAGCQALMLRTLEEGDAKGYRAVADLLADVSGAKAPKEHHVVTGASDPKDVARLVRQAFGEKALPKPTTNGLNGHANGAPAALLGAEDEAPGVPGSSEN